MAVAVQVQAAVGCQQVGHSHAAVGHSHAAVGHSHWSCHVAVGHSHRSAVGHSHWCVQTTLCNKLQLILGERYVMSAKGSCKVQLSRNVECLYQQKGAHHGQAEEYLASPRR